MATLLAHDVGAGERAGCRPESFFDLAWYRSADKVGRRVSPLAHYLAHRRIQVAPNPLFDLPFYLAPR